jgi:hypothetical protein
MRGRALKISAPRRLVGDLMRFSIGVPRVTVQRHMNLAPLVTARMAQQPKPGKRPSSGGPTSSFPGRNSTNTR